MSNLLTIKVFADKVNRKTQGIYKQATNENSKLYPYVVRLDNKLYIKEEALEEVYQLNQPIQPTDTTNSNDTTNKTNQFNSTDTTNSNDTTNLKDQDTIEFFKELLREKDKQIETLTKLLDQEQHLHAQTKLLLNEYKEKEDTDTEEREDPGEVMPAQQQPKKQRSKFMRWLLGEDWQKIIWVVFLYLV